MILRRGSEAIDFDKISGWFRSSQYRATREANYRTLRPKVIVEPLVFDSDNVSDYKIFCYGGKRPGLIQVDLDRHTAHTRKYFDADWNEQGFSLIYPLSGRRVEKPRNLDRMIEVARLLSEAFSLARIDLYSDGEQCLVGEITNCPENVWGRFIPRSAETIASRMIFGARE